MRPHPRHPEITQYQLQSHIHRKNFSIAMEAQLKTRCEADDNTYQLWQSSWIYCWVKHTVFGIRNQAGSLPDSSSGSRWSLCNLALVNGGDAGLSKSVKKGKIIIVKTKGMKVAGTHET